MRKRAASAASDAALPVPLLLLPLPPLPLPLPPLLLPRRRVSDPPCFQSAVPPQRRIAAAPVRESASSGCRSPRRNGWCGTELPFMLRGTKLTTGILVEALPKDMAWPQHSGCSTPSQRGCFDLKAEKVCKTAAKQETPSELEPFELSQLCFAAVLQTFSALRSNCPLWLGVERRTRGPNMAQLIVLGDVVSCFCEQSDQSQPSAGCWGWGRAAPPRGELGGLPGAFPEGPTGGADRIPGCPLQRQRGEDVERRWWRCTRATRTNPPSTSSSGS